jgi:hypothetical protein
MFYGITDPLSIEPVYLISLFLSLLMILLVYVSLLMIQLVSLSINDTIKGVSLIFYIFS